MGRRRAGELGPIYRHVEEHHFNILVPPRAKPNVITRVTTAFNLPKPQEIRQRYLKQYKEYYGVASPRNRGRGPIVLTLGESDVRALGLKGVGLRFTKSGEQYAASYRTAFPNDARRDVEDLLRHPSPRGADLNVRLTLRGVRYQEYYVCLPRESVEAVTTYMGRIGRRVDGGRFERIKTFACRDVIVAVGTKGRLRCRLVLYQPRATKTPGYVKLEAKSLTRGKRPPLSDAAQSRMIGVLRHIVARCGTIAVSKPKQWTGTRWKDPYKRGAVEKVILRVLRAQRAEDGSSLKLKITDLLAQVREKRPKMLRRNLLETCRGMAAKGRITLHRYHQRESSVSLFSYERHLRSHPPLRVRGPSRTRR